MSTTPSNHHPVSRYLVYGGKGWIGSQWTVYLKEEYPEIEVIYGSSRCDDLRSVEEELVKLSPSHVVLLIGRTHGPGYATIDYLETPGKLVENIRDNLFCPIAMSLFQTKYHFHLTYLGTGCIFDDHPSVRGDVPFTEEDEPNFFGSSYSIVKGFTDRLLHHPVLQPTLNLRIRMPIAPFYHPRNFITKIVQYEKVCSIANSMSVLSSLFPYMTELIQSKEKGTWNLCNPGAITHQEILEMYKEIVDPSYEWKTFSIEEQNQILLSKRSNNHLDTRKLQRRFPSVPPIHAAVQTALHYYRNTIPV